MSSLKSERLENVQADCLPCFLSDICTEAATESRQPQESIQTETNEKYKCCQRIRILEGRQFLLTFKAYFINIKL